MIPIASRKGGTSSDSMLSVISLVLGAMVVIFLVIPIILLFVNAFMPPKMSDDALSSIAGVTSHIKQGLRDCESCPIDHRLEMLVAISLLTDTGIVRGEQTHEICIIDADGKLFPCRSLGGDVVIRVDDRLRNPRVTGQLVSVFISGIRSNEGYNITIWSEALS